MARAITRLQFVVLSDMKTWLFFLVLVLSLLIHGPLNLKKNLLSRDDGWLTMPLQGVHGLADWWTLVRTGTLPDFQPVRDFSYWLDWQFAGLAGAGPYFHLTNFLLWLAIVWLMWRIAIAVFADALPDSKLSLRHPGVLLAAALVVLLAIHPVAVEAVAWVSGRKHLLSLFFTLLATAVVLGAAKDGRWGWRPALVVPGCYLLACLAQPINVLWPVWTCCFFFNNGRIWKTPGNRLVLPVMMTLLLCILAMTVMLNITVYQGKPWFGFLLTPHAEIYGRKIDGFRADEVGLSLLAIGRYFFNLLLPFKLAHRYSPGSWANLAGLLVLPVLLWSGFRSKRSRDFMLWSLHASLPVLVVTAQLSQIFVADSYAISALPGFLLAAGVIAQDRLPVAGRLRLAFFAIAGMILAMSMSLSRAWMSLETMWFRSNLVEETPDSLYFTGEFMLSDGKHEQAMQHAMKLVELSGLNNKSIRLVAAVVCSHTGIPLDIKFQRFRQLGISETPPVMDCLAEVHRKSGNHGEETKLLLRILDEAPAYFRMEIRGGRDRLQLACSSAPLLTRECTAGLQSLTQGTEQR